MRPETSTEKSNLATRMDRIFARRPAAWSPFTMPHDPNELFDHAVLDMIEQSVAGSVPMTPAYQDALKRLYRTHQVYASADNRDGHVTARSLAGRPSFSAANLEAVADGSAPAEAMEPNDAIFERYLRSLPAVLRPGAEAHRLRVVGRPVHHRPKHTGAERLPAAHDLVHTIFLVPGCGPHPGLPGNYLYGSVVETGAEGGADPWAVHVHDRDDGAAVAGAASLAAAAASLQELLGCAPFAMDELGALGFRIV
jgi:hypothetical protein